MEEERRLFYVAVTRACDELYLTYPYMRLNAGYGDMFQRPSRFLLEVPTELVEKWRSNAVSELQGRPRSGRSFP